MTLLRAISLAFSLLLGVASMWLLLSELSRPGIAVLPTTQQMAKSASDRRPDALRAARFGVLRGDLWAEAAFTYADLEWADAVHANPGDLEGARSSSTSAVTLAPVNAPVWLLLADLSLRSGWQAPNPIEALKMSYYTAPHADWLAPLRLRVAARANVADDPELERLFQGDLESILTYRPSLRPAFVDAYGQASAEGKHIMESAAEEVDPPFALTLRGTVLNNDSAARNSMGRACRFATSQHPYRSRQCRWRSR